MVAFAWILNLDPTSVCHFCQCGQERCVAIVTKVIYPEAQLKYAHGEFDTLGDLLQCNIVDLQAQRVFWDWDEMIPKTSLYEIAKTYIEGEKVDMLSCLGKVLGVGN